MDDKEYMLFGKPIERLKRPFCEKCADFWKKKEYLYCWNCFNEINTLYFGIIRSPGIYKPKERGESHLSIFVRKFKYDHMSDTERWTIAEKFASILCEYLSEEPEIIEGVTFLVPIPMTDLKEMEKGFNHTKMITEKFSEKIGIRAEYDNLIKIKETESQTNLKRDERRENVKGAFKVKYPNRFKGRKILLIDDVATTCATIDECARVLKNAGAQEVNALVLARDTKPMGDSSE